MKPIFSNDLGIPVCMKDDGTNTSGHSGLVPTAPCALFGLIVGCALIALTANAVEIAAKNSPARITINTQPTTVSIWYVHKASSDIAYVKNHFQEQLKRIGSTGRIVSCDPVVEMQGINTFQGEESFTPASIAAACKVRIDGRSIEVIMCDFPMVGKFSTASSGYLDLDWFAGFITANCPAGG